MSRIFPARHDVRRRTVTIDYLTDVLIRVHHHPASAVVDLLPHRWKPPDSASAIVAK